MLRKLGFILLFIMFVYVYEHMLAGAQRGQRKMLDPTEPELRAVVGCPGSLLGTELQSPERAASALKH